MKFYGIGQVWNKEMKKILCSFGGTNFDGNGYTIPGAYETSDEKEIKLLKELGYETDFQRAIEKLRKSDSDKVKEQRAKSPTLKSQVEADQGEK